MNPRSEPWAASLSVALCGAAWGVYWLPLRELQAMGFGSAWATAALFIACLPAVIPLAVLARRELRNHGRALIGLAVANGAAFSLYSNAYGYTSIFNVLFLFYLSPVWSVLIARFWQGERVAAIRMGCVALGLLGLMVMLSADGGWPVPRNLGDWMALIAGLLWALISVVIRRNQHIGAAANTVAFFLGGLPPALLLTLLTGTGGVPDVATIVGAAPLLLGVAWLGWVPAQILLFWGVRRISPVRTGILLMTELLSGAASAAWFSGDPLSWHQIVGALLILLAGMGDVLTGRETAPPSPVPVRVAD